MMRLRFCRLSGCQLCKKLKEAMLSPFKENVLHRDGAAFKDGIFPGRALFLCCFYNEFGADDCPPFGDVS